MGEELLVDEQKKAGSEFLREFDRYAPVSVACWVVPVDATEPCLYVASDQIDDSNFDLAYGEVLRQLGGHKVPWLDPFQVKVLNSGDPLAQKAMAIRDHSNIPNGTVYRGSSLGGTAIDHAYIYPPISQLNVTT